MFTKDCASRPLALTAMECLVLRLSATGLTTGEVAEHLRIGLDQARRHLRDAIVALGASSKLEAVVIALRRGLIDLPGA